MYNILVEESILDKKVDIIQKLTSNSYKLFNNKIIKVENEKK